MSAFVDDAYMCQVFCSQSNIRLCVHARIAANHVICRNASMDAKPYVALTAKHLAHVSIIDESAHARPVCWTFLLLQQEKQTPPQLPAPQWIFLLPLQEEKPVHSQIKRRVKERIGTKGVTRRSGRGKAWPSRPNPTQIEGRPRRMAQAGGYKRL